MKEALGQAILGAHNESLQPPHTCGGPLNFVVRSSGRNLVLGWYVLVFRKGADAPKQLPLALWETGVFGLEWLDDLVKAEKAVNLGGDGYPKCYSITAGVLLPVLAKGLPSNRSPLVIGDDYLLPPGWNGQLELDLAALSACPTDETLFIEAWDQS